MKLFNWLAALVLIVVFSGCKKENSGIPDANIAKANEFKTILSSKTFQISLNDGYYSDAPIDYIDTDAEVKEETDLWKYVSPWIKDDFNVFDVSSGTVSIKQNESKIDGNTEEYITKPFSVVVEKDGVYVNFLTYQYNPLKYHLVEFNDDYFIVSADWTGGAKVFTKFVAVQ